MKIGIICGHEISELTRNSDKIIIETEYGNVLIDHIDYKDSQIFFINRHGENSNIPPHKINYHANIQAFSSIHIKNILSIGTVGSMKKNFKIGNFVIPHDFIDFTKSRNYTFFDENRIHVDMTESFCLSLRKLLIKSCNENDNVIFYDNGIYLSTEGPRLETPSEINFFSNYTDIVGMTLVPEIVLAKEKGICYSSLCVICNMAAGLQRKLSVDEIKDIYNLKEPLIYNVIKSFIKNIENKKECNCTDDLTQVEL